MALPRVAWLLAAVLLGAVATAAAQEIPTEPLRFDEAGRVAVAKGRISGGESVDLTFTAQGGERVVAQLDAGTNGYFNVLPPGSTGEAIFIGSTDGGRFEGKLDVPGEYRLRIYQMRATARRGEAFDWE
ncbi:MAG: DNA breaking-rejoining protein [Pseudomonadota bacterium]